MALRNVQNIIDRYDSSNIIQKDFETKSPTPLDKSAYDSQYSNYNKSGINFKLKTPNDKQKISGTSLIARHVFDDTIRLGTFFLSMPGMRFTGRQSALNSMNPKTEHFGRVNPNRKFNPLSIMTTAIGAPTIGLRSSRSPIPKRYYETVTKEHNTDISNRLIKVYKELKIDKFNDTQTQYSILPPDGLINRIKDSKIVKFINDKLEKQGTPIRTFSGLGGPKSVLGAGFTIFRKYNLGLDISLKYTNSNGKTSYYPNRTFDNKYNGGDSQILDLYNKLYVDDKLQPGETLNDGAQLNKTTIGNLNNFQSIADFEKQQIAYPNFESKESHEKRNDTFKNEPAYKNKYNDSENYYENWNYFKRLNIPEAKIGESDLINEALDANMLENYEIISQDFVKIKIGNMQFRCIMSGLSESIAPEWNSTRYIGRPDDVYTYQGAKRTISFQMVVYAFSVREMRGIYDKLNKLYQYASPIINNGLMTGQVINLKLGDWFSTKESLNSSEKSAFSTKEKELKNKYEGNDNLSSRIFGDSEQKIKSGFAPLSNRGKPVIMDSISVTVDDNYTWDILMELPMAYTVDLSFTVIGNQSPSSDTIYFADGLMKS